MTVETKDLTKAEIEFLSDKCEKLEKQLKIAVDILEVISTHTCFCDEDTKEQVSIVYNWSSEALEQIEELDK